METTRLLLRDRTRTAIAHMLTQTQEQQLEFFGFESITELEEKLDRIEKGLSNKKVDYKIFDLVEKKTQKVIGSGGFHNWIKEHSRSEIGYSIHEKYRNQGYMKEAMKKILEHGFTALGLNRIEALIEPENIISIRLIENYGFIREGILREHYKEGEVYEDSLLYSLLKSDFVER